ncbi:hypothetical protein Ocin01_11635 [Orchesella cincta]|uniref:Uncharacterized protein n=1 Tax=Orchesella cincta TaxID=48709 RepID=A0A1D2MPW5_ORCCI|nr:hypothetical protein Ocin01_11635 [Orchesella cincta]
MTFPSALSFSSTRCILTLSGNAFLKCCSSWSVVEFGTNKPCLFPTVIRPIILQPATDVCTTGITSDNSDSNMLQFYHIKNTLQQCLVVMISTVRETRLFTCRNSQIRPLPQDSTNL